MGILSSCFNQEKNVVNEVSLSSVPDEPEERPLFIEDLPPDAQLHPELLKVYEECKAGRSSSIKSLRLLWRDLSGDHCSYLNFLLTKCPDIEELALKNNDLGAIGLVRLGPGLKNLKKLKKLSISQNKLTDVGLQNLATLLDSHTELVELTLDNNQLTDIQPLVFLMQRLPKLKIVWLQMNRIANAEMFLTYKGTATELNLAGNPVDEGLGLRIREVFPQLIL